jgi:hypothetical protein
MRQPNLDSENFWAAILAFVLLVGVLVGLGLLWRADEAWRDGQQIECTRRGGVMVSRDWNMCLKPRGNRGKEADDKQG